MTDRELLELAAQAVGMGPLDFDYVAREGHGFNLGPRLPMPKETVMAAMHTYWNPLKSDGDAFRLAVKLSLDIYQQTGEVQACNQYVDDDTHVWARESHNDNPCAATRRAIVRVAAAIGGDK